MDDIAPKLLDKIQKEYDKLLKDDGVVKEVIEKIANGTANYQDANSFALTLGNILSKSYNSNLSSSVLPDGKMYYNIAKSIIEPTMRNNYDLISGATSEIQTILNKQANIGIKALKPEINQDRIDGIINKISNADDFDAVKWVLKAPIENFSQNIVDESIKQNAEFHANSGMRPKIIRRLAGGCCEWCAAVAGTYSYPDVPKDVYRRHSNCRCTVEYHPGDGKVQNVHTKQWQTTEENAKIEMRKAIGLKVNNTTIQSISDHVIHRIDERSVLAESIIDAINEPLNISEVKYDELNRPSFQVIGKKATIAVNPNTGVITSTWPTHTKLARKLQRKKE